MQVRKSCMHAYSKMFSNAPIDCQAAVRWSWGVRSNFHTHTRSRVFIAQLTATYSAFCLPGPVGRQKESGHVRTYAYVLGCC